MFRAGSRTAELTEGLILPPSVPDYDFRPVEAFRTGLGGEIRFEIINPFDLMLQERGLMADALVVEATASDGRTSTIWMRYRADELSVKGSADCVLFPEEVKNVVFDGVCGVLYDRRRV